MKIITVNPERCTACRICELACSMKHVGEFNPARARIHVIGVEEEFCLPVMCFQCEKPYCAEVCPANAIVKDEATGIVRVIKDRCTGCRICILACPFGNMLFSSETKTAENCNLCDGEPECVAVCPTSALEFKEVDTAREGSLSARLRAIHQGAPLDISKLLMSIEARKAWNYHREEIGEERR
jgi:carbon-monoxide dehydrogenase iron sulfur subunit